MEYIGLKTVHPTWLTLQLPGEVANLLLYDPEEGSDPRVPGRGIAYLARGPRIVRVVSAYASRELLPIEIMRGRYLATAHPTSKLLHNLPQKVIQHLGVRILTRGPKGAHATDDELLWFVPAPEYYEYRARERLGKGWLGPSTGGFAHVYLAKSILPLPGEFLRLAELEDRIEAEEWTPRIAALNRSARTRPSS